jgi:hypothetical protein
VPSSVLQTAIAAAGNSTLLTAKTWQDNTMFRFMFFLYFADFQNTQFRQFDIYLDDSRLVPVIKSYSPAYLSSSSVYVESYRATDGKYSITLASTNTSVLPPMINALEIYLRVPCEGPTTLPKDCESCLLSSLALASTKIPLFCSPFLNLFFDKMAGAMTMIFNLELTTPSYIKDRMGQVINNLSSCLIDQETGCSLLIILFRFHCKRKHTLATTLHA